MSQFSKVLLAINNAHIVPQRALDCEPGLGGLNQVYGSNCPVHSPITVCMPIRSSVQKK